MLNDAGSRNDPIALDGDSDDSELHSDDFDDEDMDMDIADLDIYDAEDMMINVEVRMSNLPRAEVMFTVPRAVAIYKDMLHARFPLPIMTAVRYGIPSEGASPDSASTASFAPSLTSGQPSVSSATSYASPAEMLPGGTGRDYVFDFGKYSGKRFLDVPEAYLRTIGGQLHVYDVKHAGLREAFDYYRPGQARSVAPAPVPRRHKLKSQPQPQPQQQPQVDPQTQPRTQPQVQPHTQARPLLPVAPKRKSAKGLSETWTFQKGVHKGKRLADVPENYIRTLEGVPTILTSWQGFKAALEDFNKKTGRQGKRGKST